MNPWLQRFLISWAAGIATTGAVVSTAKRPHKLKKKKRKKAPDGTLEPVQIGQVALKDARLPEERGLTVGEWRDAVVARGKSVANVFKRKPKEGEPVLDEGGAREPDEVQRSDGTVERKSTSSAARKKKRKGSPAKRRRGQKRKQATLWDSAKESFKQTVKDTVHEEVNKTPVGGALDALKKVGATVKDGATKAASTVQTAVNKALDNGQGGGGDVDELPEVLPPDPTTPRPISEVPSVASIEELDDVAPPELSEPGAIRPVKKGVDVEKIEEKLDQFGDSVKKGVENLGERISEVKAEDIAESAAKVGAKVKEGLNVVGRWVQGTAANASERRRRSGGTGDVVEAKEAPSATTPSAENATSSPTSSSTPGAEPVKGEIVDDSDDSDDKAAQ